MTDLLERPARHHAAPARAPKEADNPLASVSKALLLLDGLKSANGPVGVSGLARSTGMAKSTTFRLLSHLEESGFVERAGRSYVLGWRLFELGNHVAPCRPHGLRSVAVPHMTELLSQTGMAVQLGILRGTEVIYLEKLHGTRAVTVATVVGGRAPATCTALGKALLAHLPADELRKVISGSLDEHGLNALTRFSIRQPGRVVDQLREIRAGGIAREREEAQVGVISVAAPVLVDGKAVAALSISSPIGAATAEAYAPAVQRAAHAIARGLTGQR